MNAAGRGRLRRRQSRMSCMPHAQPARVLADPGDPQRVVYLGGGWYALVHQPSPVNAPSSREVH
jgi:hypothetical protein